MKNITGLLCFLLVVLNMHAQTFSITGRVLEQKSGDPLPYVKLQLEPGDNISMTDSNGSYKISNLKSGTYLLSVTGMGYKDTQVSVIVIDRNLKKNIQLAIDALTLDSVVIRNGDGNTFGVTKLKDVEGTAIYAGKKSEVIIMKDITANTATNNTRQIYAKITGLNIFENDGAGIQLAIGGRGLNPNRVTNFNTRQNGYDMSADALGYPESYYSPPAELIERVEIIRGAASLQYGTQFGGLVNFKLKSPPADKKMEFMTRQTMGSYGFFNTANSISGTINKVSYSLFEQYKFGNGWRPNSEFHVNTLYASAGYNINRRVSLNLQYTSMTYLAHQPGGLTDKEFDDDPRQSVRSRNWFKVNWNLGALLLDYKINNHLKFNSRFFGLLANRSALGILTFINRADPGGNRDLWTDAYKNWGTESRLLYNYNIKTVSGVLLGGVRFYSGHTDRKQGLGNAGSAGGKEDFTFDEASSIYYSRYKFPNYNLAVFLENIFHVTSKFSVVPGIRFEHIRTQAEGFYSIVNKDLAGNIIFDERIEESRLQPRSFVLAGLGLAYNQNDAMRLYANVSQNYRAINFNDMRVINPNLQVDPDLKDEKGYSADVGMRGELSEILSYDVDFFILKYDNRIGTILKTDTVTFNVYNFRTNVSQSRHLGLESFVELDILRLIKGAKSKARLSVFSNCSFIDARYVHSKASAYENKKVELAPFIVFKSGVNFKIAGFSASYQISYTSKQFTDATNSTFTANAINGLIPAYYVMDLSVEYAVNKYLTFSGTINNLSDKRYFTRRADSYPGPGIVPSDGIGFYATMQIKL